MGQKKKGEKTEIKYQTPSLVRVSFCVHRVWYLRVETVLKGLYTHY